MRIVYLGTPDFAVKPLERLIENGYQVVAVVTNRDKPVGRKKIITPPPVKVFAMQAGIPVFQYDKIRSEGVEDLKALSPDVMITCAFGQILSQEIIDIPKFGVINIHASLLPKYRGASPIHYAILNGEEKTGVTIMRTDVGIDTGDIVLQKEIDILKDETCGELFERLSDLGAECIIEALPDIASDSAQFVKQKEEQASYSKIIKKEDGKINFNDSAKSIVNKIRAFNPAPVAYCEYCGQPFKVYSATAVDKKGEIGEILEAKDNLVIGCKDGAIALLRVQKSGGNAMDIKDFLRGNKLNVGDKFI